MLADVTNVVRLVGKKLWVPSQVKQQLKLHGCTNNSPQVETSCQEPEIAAVDATALQDLRGKTCTARRMVSAC